MNHATSRRPRPVREALAALVITALAALPALALPGADGGAEAGELRLVAPEQLKCVRRIRSGDALLGGIHVGNLPEHIIVQRCGGLWLSLRQRDGMLRKVSVPPRMVPSFRPRSKPFAIPDARVAVGGRDIAEAWLTRPTRRYAHGVLGDAIEAGGLAVSSQRTRRRVELVLPEDQVFEDRLARLADVDGDSATDEIIVVRTHLRKGASLAVYGLRGEPGKERLQLLAHSPWLGRANRWLNPAAVADFDGDGKVEIAWVETPHIGGVLKVGRLEKAGDRWRLRELAALKGFSNHSIGSRILQQAVAVDFTGDGQPEIVLPTQDRRHIAAVRFDGEKLKVVDTTAIRGELDSSVQAADIDGDGVGEVYLINRDGLLQAVRPSASAADRPAAP